VNEVLDSPVEEIAELEEQIFNEDDSDDETENNFSEGVAIIPLINIRIIDILQLSENDYDCYNDEFMYNLPKHHCCAAHTLNLIATKVNYHIYLFKIKCFYFILFSKNI